MDQLPARDLPAWPVRTGQEECSPIYTYGSTHRKRTHRRGGSGPLQVRGTENYYLFPFEGSELSGLIVSSFPVAPEIECSIAEAGAKKVYVTIHDGRHTWDEKVIKRIISGWAEEGADLHRSKSYLKINQWTVGTMAMPEDIPHYATVFTESDGIETRIKITIPGRRQLCPLCKKIFSYIRGMPTPYTK